MDPLSITTACVSLLDVAARTAIAISGFIQDCRGARNGMTAISRELLDLKAILDLLKANSETTEGGSIPESMRMQIISLLSSCNDVILKIDNLLERHTGAFASVKWVADGRKEAANLCRLLAVHRATLSLTLETTNLSLNQSIKIDTTNVKKDTSQILVEIAYLRSLIAQDQPGNFILERFLDSVTTYADSVAADEDRSPPLQMPDLVPESHNLGREGEVRSPDSLEFSTWKYRQKGAFINSNTSVVSKSQYSSRWSVRISADLSVLAVDYLDKIKIFDVSTSTSKLIGKIASGSALRDFDVLCIRHRILVVYRWGELQYWDWSKSFKPRWKDQRIITDLACSTAMSSIAYLDDAGMREYKCRLCQNAKESHASLTEPDFIGDLIAYSQDGSLIVVGSSNGTVMVKHRSSLGSKSWKKQGYVLRPLSIASDGNRVVSIWWKAAVGGQEIITWDLRSNVSRCVDIDPSYTLDRLSLSRDGKFLVGNRLAGASYPSSSGKALMEVNTETGECSTVTGLDCVGKFLVACDSRRDAIVVIDNNAARLYLRRSVIR